MLPKNGMMNPSGVAFTRRILRTIDKRLLGDLSARSTLGSGAAFEAWLAFETRILLERAGILDKGAWAQNEHQKCDLAVHRCNNRSTARVLEWIAEYKVVYPNHRWKEAARAVKADLFPKGKVKSRLDPELGRAAVVALVGKKYRPGFQGNFKDCGVPRHAWRGEVLNAIANAGAEVVFTGRKHKLVHEWLEPGSWIQLFAFAVRSRR